MEFSMSNIKYNTVLFTNQSDNPKAPQFSGYVTVPVSRIDEMIELLRSRKVFQDNGEDTVRIPLSFWTATGKAPLAFKGLSSFQVLEGTPIKQTMSVAPVDKAPAIDF
jgi:hypothetical protein